ncbi:MAG TPA: hypothetical protein PLQ75_04060 [Anaerolineales bacterium]|nr:hypothetical protein [Anaerolineales bacterium]
MFRRARRLLRGAPVPAVPPALRNAHRLMESGNYAEAALAFYDLARKAEERFPERAPILYTEAGRAAVLNGDAKKGVTHFRSALTLLSTQQRYRRLQSLGERIVAELRERGLNAEADEVASVLRNNAQVSAGKEAPAPQKRAVLPTHCPSCGAAVRPDEVEWLDDVTAECDYCGSPVRAES